MADREDVARVLSDDNVYIPVDGEKCQDRLGIADKLLQQTLAYVLMPNETLVAIFLPHNPYLYTGHIAVLPEGRGKEAIAGGKAALQWMFDNTECIKIFGLMATFSRHGILYIKMLGFRQTHIVTRSYVRAGEVFDQVMLELEKPCA
jgi:hypothetical protein